MSHPTVLHRDIRILFIVQVIVLFVYVRQAAKAAVAVQRLHIDIDIVYKCRDLFTYRYIVLSLYRSPAYSL